MTQSVQEKIRYSIKRSRLRFKIKAVFLYGSFATKKADENSDVDILIITYSKINKEIENEIEQLLQQHFLKTIDISIYDEERFKRLLVSGSLFLHHINNEGDLVYSDREKTKDYYFNELKEFKGVSEDILLYERLLNAAEISIKKNGVNYFDLRVLAMITRNTLIVMNYYKYKGKTRFGKFDVFESLKNEFDDLSLDEYKDLMNYRSFYNRNCPYIDLPSISYINKIIRSISTLVEYAKDSIGLKDNIDRFNFILEDANTRNFYTSFEIFIGLERDLYMNLKKYIEQKYNNTVTSLNHSALQLLNERYNEDYFIILTSNIVSHIDETKKISNNYTIEFADIDEVKQYLVTQNNSNKLKRLIIDFVNKLVEKFNALFNKEDKYLDERINNSFKKDLEKYIALRNEIFK